tara:strand:+ start:65 stop:658 length:594 start_codon:yes stop_codon:yes gene_type:complete
MEIKEIKDFLPPSLQRHVRNVLLDRDFDWHYISDVTFDDRDLDKGYKTQPGFFNLPLVNGTPQNKFFDFFSFFVPLLLDEYQKHYPPANVSLSRMRIGLNIPGDDDLGYNNPHIDHEGIDTSRIKTNVVALYYCDSTPGDTFIFNETERSSEYTIKRRVSPEQGKLVFFDGNHYHSSSSSKSKDVRVVISFNLYEYH